MSTNKSKTPFYLIDTSSPFYRPLPLRIGICAVVLSWLGLELYGRDPFWMVISGAMAIYCLYVLLYAYRPPEDAPTPSAEPRQDEDEQETPPGGQG